MKHRRIILLLALIFSPLMASAEKEVIEFPEEELARQTALPKFDRTEAVKVRAINLEKRFEVGGGMGWNLTEALYNNINFNFSVGYNFSETHGFAFTGIFVSQGLSSMGKDLKAGKNLDPGDSFDASLAPRVTSMYVGNYQFTAYYGKISVSKQLIMHLSMYGLAGLGLVTWTDTQTLGYNLGIGQKLYFTEHLAIRMDFRLMMYPGPDPTSKPLNDGLEKKTSELKTTTYDHTFLTINAVYLF